MEDSWAEGVGFDPAERGGLVMKRSNAAPVRINDVEGVARDDRRSDVEHGSEARSGDVGGGLGTKHSGAESQLFSCLGQIPGRQEQSVPPSVYAENFVWVRMGAWIVQIALPAVIVMCHGSVG